MDPAVAYASISQKSFDKKESSHVMWHQRKHNYRPAGNSLGNQYGRKMVVRTWNLMKLWRECKQFKTKNNPTYATSYQFPASNFTGIITAPGKGMTVRRSAHSQIEISCLEWDRDEVERRSHSLVSSKMRKQIKPQPQGRLKRMACPPAEGVSPSKRTRLVRLNPRNSGPAGASTGIFERKKDYRRTQL